MVSREIDETESPTTFHSDLTGERNCFSYDMVGQATESLWHFVTNHKFKQEDMI